MVCRVCDREDKPEDFVVCEECDEALCESCECPNCPATEIDSWTTGGVVNLCSVCGGDGPTSDSWICKGGAPGNHRTCIACRDNDVERNTLINPHPSGLLCGLKACNDFRDLSRLCDLCGFRSFRTEKRCEECNERVCLECVSKEDYTPHACL